MPLDYFYLGEVILFYSDHPLRNRHYFLNPKSVCLFLLPQIRNSDSQNCLDTMGRKGGENVGISYCHGLGGNQVFAYTKRQQIMSDDNCLDSTGTDGIVKLIRCHGMGGNQAWLYDAEVLFYLLQIFFFSFEIEIQSL